MGLNNRIRIKLTRICVIFLLIAWGLLKPEFVRFADLVYSYRGFMLLNLLVCGTTAYLAILALVLRRYFWLLFFGLIAIIINPVSPFYMGRLAYLLIAMFLALSIHAFRVLDYFRVRQMKRILGVIADPDVRSVADTVLKEVRYWEDINIKPMNHYILIGVDVNAFSSLEPQKDFFTIYTHNTYDEQRKSFPIKSISDWEAIKPVVRASYEFALEEEGLNLQ